MLAADIGSLTLANAAEARRQAAMTSIMLAFIRSCTTPRIFGCIAGIEMVLTILTGTIPDYGPCTTSISRLPLPFYSDNCECMEHIGPEWHLGNALIDWALLSVPALVFPPLVHRSFAGGSRSWPPAAPSWLPGTTELALRGPRLCGRGTAGAFAGAGESPRQRRRLGSAASSQPALAPLAPLA